MNVIGYPRRGPRDKHEEIPSSIDFINSSDMGASVLENLCKTSLI